MSALGRSAQLVKKNIEELIPLWINGYPEGETTH
jgi:hypothetical protein